MSGDAAESFWGNDTVMVLNFIVGFGHSRPSLSEGDYGRLATIANPYVCSANSTSTSQPFDVGMPVPSVTWPISLQVGGP